MIGRDAGHRPGITPWRIKRLRAFEIFVSVSES
jgi:hypothetical protein